MSGWIGVHVGGEMEGFINKGFEKGLEDLTSLYSIFPICTRSLSTEQPSCHNCLSRASLNGTNSVAGVAIPRVSENVALVKQDTSGIEPTSPGLQTSQRAIHFANRDPIRQREPVIPGQYRCYFVFFK